MDESNLGCLGLVATGDDSQLQLVDLPFFHSVRDSGGVPNELR